MCVSERESVCVSECVYVCVCVSERERESVCVCSGMNEKESARKEGERRAGLLLNGLRPCSYVYEYLDKHLP